MLKAHTRYTMDAVLKLFWYYSTLQAYVAAVIFSVPLRNDVLLPEQEEQAGKHVKQLSFLGLERGHVLDTTEHILDLKNIVRGGNHHHH